MGSCNSCGCARCQHIVFAETGQGRRGNKKENLGVEQIGDQALDALGGGPVGEGMDYGVFFILGSSVRSFGGLCSQL